MKGQRAADVAFEASQGGQPGPLQRVANPDLVHPARTRNALAVRAESDRRHASALALPGRYLLTTVGVPQANRPVAAAPSQLLAVRTTVEGGDPCRQRQRLRGLPALHVPDADLALTPGAASAGQAPAIGMEDQVANLMAVSFQPPKHRAGLDL